MWTMLSTRENAQATARWFVQQGILRQFDLAREIEEEEVESSFKKENIPLEFSTRRVIRGYPR